ncbi:integral membrane protein-like protein [Lophiotrema nucula]|uniref:Integral membrane protein-like protein n=1 Tax=Lophiotrema nucula TaxID=690887 RepID=A0A6A5ZBM7_9PLEO|nr:integral membrane protein-like protein [Lophiotrema nucula]
MAITAQEAAARERVIKHMNADHQDSLRRYLEHFKGASSFSVRNARMTDININCMQFEYAGKHGTITFDPPLKSLREARERLVQLDKDALQALGRSDIQITKFIPCYTNAFHLINWTTCFLTYLVYCRPANFKPGSLLFDNVLYKYPGFVKFSLAIQPYQFPIMVGIHLFESVLMARKLARHGVLVSSLLWWAWVGTCFVEGFTSFNRLDEHIAEKQAAKDAKKH